MANVFVIRAIKKNDIKSVVDLHIQYISSNLIDCKYSRNLFMLFYNSFVDNNDNISFVAELNGAIVGYICVVKSLNELYLMTLSNNFIKVVINLMSLIILHAKIIYIEFINKGKILLRRRYSDLHLERQAHHFPLRETQLHELRPIVVRHEYHGTELASALIERAESALKKRNAGRYFLRVYRDNLRAINFYRKAGFIDVGSEGSNTLVMEKALDSDF
jgi:ribosomal protein S18 acetylase RimI-like enzyme